MVKTSARILIATLICVGCASAQGGNKKVLETVDAISCVLSTTIYGMPKGDTHAEVSCVLKWRTGLNECCLQNYLFCNDCLLNEHSLYVKKRHLRKSPIKELSFTLNWIEGTDADASRDLAFYFSPLMRSENPDEYAMQMIRVHLGEVYHALLILNRSGDHTYELVGAKNDKVRFH